MDKRHILTKQDSMTLNRAKQILSICIEDLKQDNVRHANIEIELVTHIRNELKKGGHQ